MANMAIGGNAGGGAFYKIVIILVILLILALIGTLLALLVYSLLSGSDEDIPLVETKPTLVVQTTKTTTTVEATSRTMATTTTTRATTTVRTTAATTRTTTRATTTTTEPAMECTRDSDCHEDETYYECSDGDVYRIERDYWCEDNECVWEEDETLSDTCADDEVCVDGESQCQQATTTTTTESSSTTIVVTSTSSASTTTTTTTTEPVYDDQYYFDLAINGPDGPDASQCDFIVKPDTKNDCYSAVAVLLDDETICNYIQDDPVKKEGCIAEITSS